MLDSRRDPFHRVVYRVDFYLSRHRQKQRKKKGKSSVERSKKKEVFVEKKEIEKRRKKKREKSVERILGRRNKFHFPARCTDFSSVSVESPPTSVPSFRPVGRRTLKIENRTSSLAESRPWTLSRQRKRKRAGCLVAKGFEKGRKEGGSG